MVLFLFFVAGVQGAEPPSKKTKKKQNLNTQDKKAIPLIEGRQGRAAIRIIFITFVNFPCFSGSFSQNWYVFRESVHLEKMSLEKMSN